MEQSLEVGKSMQLEAAHLATGSEAREAVVEKSEHSYELVLLLLLGKVGEPIIPSSSTSWITRLLSCTFPSLLIQLLVCTMPSLLRIHQGAKKGKEIPH